eukprot:m.259434 g.259434  ORF g.259434 m.259434 type:complete len:1277 (+) comp16203_c0_seq7:202-4032(+)
MKGRHHQRQPRPTMVHQENFMRIDSELAQMMEEDPGDDAASVSSELDVTLDPRRITFDKLAHASREIEVDIRDRKSPTFHQRIVDLASLMSRVDLRRFTATPSYSLGGLFFYFDGHVYAAVLAHVGLLLYLFSIALYIYVDMEEGLDRGPDVLTFHRFWGSFTQARSWRVYYIQLMLQVLFMAKHVVTLYLTIKNRNWFIKLNDKMAIINFVLSVYLIMPLIHKRYINLWTPTFLHIWHVKRIAVNIVIARVGANRVAFASATRTSSIFKALRPTVDVAAFVFTTMCAVEQIGLDEYGPFTSANIMVDDDEGVTKHNMLNAFYFIVTTVTTTGYGDISPTSTFGILMVIFIMLWSILMVGRYIGEILEAIAEMKESGGHYMKEPHHNSHIVVCAGILEKAYVQEFLDGLFVQAASRSREEDVPFVIFLSPRENSKARKLMESLDWKNRVLYLKGSALEVSDLSRASVETAKAVYVFTERQTTDPLKVDSEVLLKSWSINSYAPQVRQYVQTLLPGTASQFDKRNENIVLLPVGQFRFSLMGESCVCPGFSTLLTELGHSIPQARFEDEIKKDYEHTNETIQNMKANLKKKERGTTGYATAKLELQRKKNRLNWIAASHKYASSLQNSIYSAKMKENGDNILDKYIGWNFAHATYDALRYGVCIIAVEINDRPHEFDAKQSEGKKRRYSNLGQTIVNPLGRDRKGNIVPFYLEKDDRLFYIAKAKQECLYVKKIKPDKIERSPSNKNSQNFQGIVHTSSFHDSKTGMESSQPRRLDSNVFHPGSPATEAIWMLKDNEQNFNKCINEEGLKDELEGLGRFIIVDATNTKMGDHYGLYEIIRHIRRARKIHGELQSTKPLLVIFQKEPTADLINFLAMLPKAYYFIGTLASNSPNLKVCLSNAKIILILRAPIEDALDEDNLSDAPSMVVPGLLSKKLGVGSINNDTFTFLFELNFRNNFKYLRYNSVLGKSSRRTGLWWNERLQYAYSPLYQRGSAISDTFIDIVTGQVLFSSAPKGLISVYEQLLGVHSMHNVHNVNSISRLGITDDLLTQLETDNDSPVTYDTVARYCLEKLGAVPLGMVYNVSHGARSPADGDNESRASSAVTNDFFEVSAATVLCNPALTTELDEGDYVFILGPSDLNGMCVHDELVKADVFEKPVDRNLSEFVHTGDRVASFSYSNPSAKPKVSFAEPKGNETQVTGDLTEDRVEAVQRRDTQYSEQSGAIDRLAQSTMGQPILAVETLTSEGEDDVRPPRRNGTARMDDEISHTSRNQYTVV